MDTQKPVAVLHRPLASIGSLALNSSDSSSPDGSASLRSVLSAFVPTLLLGLSFVAAFIIIRQRYPKIYAPRTYIGTIPEKDRTPSASRSYFNWAHTLRVLSDKFVLHHSSLDAYLYLRFLRTIILICVVGCCITWPILMPINATGGGTSTELDKITIGNVVLNDRLYAHATVAWVFFGFVMFTVARERLWLIGLRQAWSQYKPNANRLSSRTALFLSAPREALEERNLSHFFGENAVRIWPVTPAGALESLVSHRNAMVEKLEGLELSLEKRANNALRQEQRMRQGPDGSGSNYESLSQDVRRKLRPVHRAKASPIGDKIDSIEYVRNKIKETEAEIDKLRGASDPEEDHEGAASAFVEFRTQAAAQQAVQQVASSQILTLTPKYLAVTPQQVIWENLTIHPARRLSQEGLATALVIAAIVFWSIPIAFVGAISNVSYLAENYEWLRWLDMLPDTVKGLLTGLLPPFLTNLLSKYVPNIFRNIFKSAGEPTNASAELKVQRWFFVFQVTQVFLVTALSSAAAAVVAQIIQDPTSIPMLLAERIPRSSNYYLSYFIVQGMTSSTDNLLNYSDLLTWLGFDYLLDKTPRQKYNSYISLKGIAWGKVYPKFANFAVIAIVYSCIAPLVTGFAAAGLAMFYLSYRYMLMFTVQPKIDTNGRAYTLALQHMLTGVYLAELCLIGLFGIHKATGPIIMTVVLLGVTIIYNSGMNRYFKPLEEFLPMDLMADAEDQTPLLSSAEEGDGESRIQHLGNGAHIPSRIVDPIARFLEPSFFASRKAIKAWLEEDDLEDEIPEYSEDQISKAYVNPAFTSQTPVVWFPRDEGGVSRNEINELQEMGIKADDSGAWLDRKNRVKWDELGIPDLPVFKKGVKY